MPVTTNNYHEWLKMLNIYSLQRQSEQYAIILIYKIVIQLVTDPQLEIHCNPRTKNVTPKQNISRASPVCVNSLRIGSVLVIGSRLCSSIAATLTELENDDEGEKQKVKNFKKELIKYLRTTPDVPGTSPNSLLQQKQNVRCLNC